ncbi:hypothetical protein ABIA27_003049 [Sinorhizobium fredii]
MEVADERHVQAELQQPLADLRHGGGTFVAVDGNPHQLGTRLVERRHLRDGRIDIGRVRIRHRLDDDRRGTADDDAADIDGHRGAARLWLEIEGRRHEGLSWSLCSAVRLTGRKKVDATLWSCGARIGVPLSPFRWRRKACLSTATSCADGELMAARRQCLLP